MTSLDTKRFVLPETKSADAIFRIVDFFCKKSCPDCENIPANPNAVFNPYRVGLNGGLLQQEQEDG